MSDTTPSIAVEFKRVMKSFGAKRVLNDVSFRIEQGRALCLLGRSGTGKSVTLKLIMALMRPDSGEVLVDQDNVVGLGEHGLSHVRKKLGYLFQDAALFDSLTLYENLALPLSRLTKKSKDEIDDVIRRVLAALIIVTHDVHGARRVADQIAVLDKGNVVAFGSVDEVSQSENEVARRLITE
jgi:ABC-type transporter Mla maintaining outer membrane lipid asymmetry ATPase subunit MlaF